MPSWFRHNCCCVFLSLPECRATEHCSQQHPQQKPKPRTKPTKNISSTVHQVRQVTWQDVSTWQRNKEWSINQFCRKQHVNKNERASWTRYGMQVEKIWMVLLQVQPHLPIMTTTNAKTKERIQHTLTQTLSQGLGGNHWNHVGYLQLVRVSLNPDTIGQSQTRTWAQFWFAIECLATGCTETSKHCWQVCHIECLDGIRVALYNSETHHYARSWLHAIKWP